MAYVCSLNNSVPLGVVVLKCGCLSRRTYLFNDDGKRKEENEENALPSFLLLFSHFSALQSE
jgi:hypothetical protein